MSTINTKENKAASITRTEALQKIGSYGKYAALTALGTYIMLSPKKAQAASPTTPGDSF
jgi:hypothetical protein